VAAKFYHGLGHNEGALVEKLTLPFTDAAPKGMTLRASLGTAVIGSSVPASGVMVYSNHPYSTSTTIDSGLPTGTAVTAVRWV